MGEARRRGIHHINELNGHVVKTPPRVRVVQNIKIQNAGEQVVLMLGNDLPELAALMTPEQARQLMGALAAHVAELERGERRIILPGQE